MLFQLLILAVNREEVFRPCQREHQLLLLLTGVAGHMHIIHGFVNYFRPKLQQPVDDLCHHFFVPGDWICRNDDKIVRADTHVPVAGAGHAGERAERLALTARCDKNDFFRRIAVDLFDIDQYVFRRMQVAQFQRHLRIVHHTAARYGHFPAGLYRKIDQLLDPVKVGGKCRYDHALFSGTAEQRLYACAHLLLGGRKAGPLGVGRIGQQRQHAALSVLGDRNKIRRAARDGGVIDFEITRLQDHTCGAADGQCNGIRDGVIHMDRLYGKTAQPEFSARRNLHKLCAAHKAVFLQLIVDQADRQPRGIYRQIDLLEQIRQAADVILMPMCDHNAPDVLFVLNQIGKIRDHKIHAEHIAVREHDAAIHQDHFALTFIQRDIFAHLAKAAQGHDAHRDRRRSGPCPGVLPAARMIASARLFRRSRFLHALPRRHSRCVFAHASGRRRRFLRARPDIFLHILHSSLLFPGRRQRRSSISAGRFSGF